MTLYDSEGKYKPDEWILGMDPSVKLDNKRVKPRKQGQGIYLPLNHSTRWKLRILKTEMGFDTWQQFIDQVLKDYQEDKK